MSNDLQFPLRRVVGFILGYLAVTLLLQLMPYDPTAALDRQGNGRDLVLPPELAAARAQGEFRVAVIGASETIAYPYAPAGAASFATLLGKGLAAVHAATPWSTAPIGEPAVDSTGLVRCAELALRAQPDVLCVTLGGNEFTRRLFITEPLLPPDPLRWIRDVTTRARLWFPRPSEEVASKTRPGFEAELLLQAVPDARPADPPFADLPLARDEIELLHERTRATMRHITAIARPRGIDVWFLLAPFDLAGTWPVGMNERIPAIDALVRRAQRDLGTVTRAEIDALLAEHPTRADLHFLLGLWLRHHGDADAARAAFVRARDLDPAPQHPTSELVELIRSTAAQLQTPFVDLDIPLAAPDGLPDPARYLDAKHPDLIGHQQIAWHLALELAARGNIPPLPEDARAQFLAATRTWCDTRLDRARIPRARSLVRWASSIFSMLSGNFRDALDLMLQTLADLRQRPEDPFGLQQLEQMAPYFFFCLYAEAGRLDEAASGTQAERDQRLRELTERLKREYAAETIQDWVDELLR